MDPWTVGIIVVIAVGIAVIAFGAVYDRRKNRRRTREMLSPPDRPIPHFAPDAPAPDYLSELQARRRPATVRSAALTTAERDEITAQLADPTTITVEVGMVSADFVTDSTRGWAVLDHPYVLACSEPIGTIREILGVLEQVMPTGRPVVVAAPDLRGDVRGTLEVNAIQQTMTLLAVQVGGDDLDRIARTAGTALIPRVDLVSGWVGVDRLGSCARWVSTATTSHLINR